MKYNEINPRDRPIENDVKPKRPYCPKCTDKNNIHNKEMAYDEEHSRYFCTNCVFATNSGVEPE